MSTTNTEAAPVAATHAAPPPRNRPIGKSPATIAWLMLVPAGVLLVTFLIIPIILTFILAFTNARLISPQPATFVGVDNFVRLFSDETFWASLRNTVIFAVVIVPVQSAVALGLASWSTPRSAASTSSAPSSSCPWSPPSWWSPCSGCSCTSPTD